MGYRRPLNSVRRRSRCLCCSSVHCSSHFVELLTPKLPLFVQLALQLAVQYTCTFCCCRRWVFRPILELSTFSASELALPCTRRFVFGAGSLIPASGHTVYMVRESLSISHLSEVSPPPLRGPCVEFICFLRFPDVVQRGEAPRMSTTS